MNQHKDMFEYVRNQLDKAEHDPQANKGKIHYERYDHTVRVYKWMIRITNELNDDNLDLESLKVATIFHDCGYGYETEKLPHPHASAIICRDYLERRDYSPEKVGFICDLIEQHSEKSRISDVETPIELVVLMEADMLDDTGAMGLILDTWIEATDEKASFESMRKHIEKYTYRHMKNVNMVTAPAKRFWHEKRKLVYDFIRQYRRDLGDMK